MRDEQVVGEITKMAPPVGVSTATFLGFTPSEWVVVLTVIYLLAQLCFLAHRWWVFRRREQVRIEQPLTRIDESDDRYG